MSAKEYDLVIIGGGPGGYVAAIRAAQLGLSVALVERAELGGICLNWGCIPTKALLRSAEVKHLIDHAADFGLKLPEKAQVDFAAVIARSRKVAKQLNQGVTHLLKKNKVTVLAGTAKLLGKGQIEVKTEDKTQKLAAKKIILATGARARSLPGLEADGKHIWSYREAMQPETLPQKLLVVGSGAIGMEFASFYRDLGADVTVVEILERILPQEDAEISDLAHKAFEKQGMVIHTAAKVEKLQSTAKGVTARITPEKGKAEDQSFDRAILAIGITGNIEDIGLEKTKAKTERGHIVTDEWSATDEPGLYAIGDVTAPPWLAHKASHEAVICVEKIAGIKNLHPLRKEQIPGCTYCRPQIASVGLTEAAAKEAGHKVRIGRFPALGNGKAIALGEPEGLVKTIFDAQTGELLGAHMIGAEVTELIQGFAIAMTLESTEAELMQTIFPHPTLSEMMHESVLDAYDRVLHI